MNFGEKLFQTKLLSRLSHKVCRLLPSPVLLRKFTNNRRNCKNRSFCWTPSLPPYHLNLGFTMFWIRTQLDFSGFNPNSNQPSIVNQCFHRELFEERNFRLKSLKSCQRNAKCPTSNSWYTVTTVNPSTVLPFLTVTSFHPLFTLNLLDSEYLQRNAA